MCIVLFKQKTGYERRIRDWSSDVCSSDLLTAIGALSDRPYNVNFFCHQTPAVDPTAFDAWHRMLAPLFAEFDIDPASIPAGATRQPFDAAMAEVLERHKPALVSFHFGLPSLEMLQRARSTRAKIASSETKIGRATWRERGGQ